MASTYTNAERFDIEGRLIFGVKWDGNPIKKGDPVNINGQRYIVEFIEKFTKCFEPGEAIAIQVKKRNDHV